MTKKAIVIASAVIAIIWSIYMIIRGCIMLIGGIWPWSIQSAVSITHFIAYVILSFSLLLIILISVSVLFDIKLNNPLRILLAVVSIVLTIGFIIISGFSLAVILGFIKRHFEVVRVITSGLGIVAIIITLLTSLHRALKPMKEGELK